MTVKTRAFGLVDWPVVAARVLDWTILRSASGRLGRSAARKNYPSPRAHDKAGFVGFEVGAYSIRA